MVLFIIPYHQVGGAEKVHLEIIRAIQPHQKVIVIFTNSHGNAISAEFKSFRHIDLKGSPAFAMLCAFIIAISSRLTRLTVFGCNNKFFYQLLPLLSGRTKTIDLTHAFSYPDWGMEDFAKKYVSKLSARIVINHRTLEDYRKQYEREGIDAKYLQRIKVIPNGIRIHTFEPNNIHNRFKDFTIGYVGRFANEKRPELFLQITKLGYSFPCSAKMIADQFPGESSDYPGLKLVIGINDPETIRKEFSEISVLLITSNREGFPLVIMEAMELGIPVISTNVGSISEHVLNGYNGYIAEEEEDEPKLIDFFFYSLQRLGSNWNLYNQLSLNARAYAEQHFGIEQAHRAYREVFFDNGEAEIPAC